MSYSRFICPDKQVVKIEDCFNSCRIKDNKELVPGGRCLSLRTLHAVADQRVWIGIPSTTQLLRGTREAYLTIISDYAVDPQKMLFALAGTKAHATLDKYTPEGCMAEERLFDGISSGAFDFYDPADGGTLYDVKTYGSYAVAKTIGIREIYVHDGFYKTGEKKGQNKWKKQIAFDGRKRRFDLAAQLNDYRIKLKKCKGVYTQQMICEIIVRDGGTYLATGRGVTQNGYLVPINKISDQWVERYMLAKRDALLSALETGVMPKPCNPRERWQDKNGKCTKCINFCSVNKFCDFGIGQVNKYGN